LTKILLISITIEYQGPRSPVGQRTDYAKFCDVKDDSHPPEQITALMRQDMINHYRSHSKECLGTTSNRELGIAHSFIRKYLKFKCSCP